MKAVVRNWVLVQPVLTFESGHKSNVFQKFSGTVVTLLYVPGMSKMQVAELPALQRCRNAKYLAQYRASLHRPALE